VDDSAHGVQHEFRLIQVSQGQVEECVRELRGGSAPGIDDFSASFLKSNIKYLVAPLTHIINLSITTGVFPEKFKIAKVVPIYKANSKSDVSNYRPISLLSVFSKILEKCVKKQLVSYIENNNLLSPQQYGFRKNKNCSDALFQVNSYLMHAINSNKKTLIVYIDLKNAFDSISRDLLFHKLECIGVRGTALRWFKSYLCERFQAVTICNVSGDLQRVEFGVVQGSTLGPLLFLIYINNISNLNLLGKLILFADDTALILQGSTWDEVFRMACHDLHLLNKWFAENILTMNVIKTKYMCISLRSAGEPPPNLALKVHSCGDPNNAACDCQTLERVHKYKYLGVIFDSKLRWEDHISMLKTKIRKFIYVFSKLRGILNNKEIKMVYCAHVQSVLQYGIIAYGGAYNVLLEPLTIVQKAILKVGFGKPRRYSTELLYRETGILSVRQLYIKTILTFVHSNRELVITPIVHNHYTRNAAQIGIRVPQIVKSINLTNSYFLANVIIRNAPTEIREILCVCGKCQGLSVCLGGW